MHFRPPTSDLRLAASRPSLAELDRRCQKLDHRRIGNWMARRISRPLALRVTWMILPYGISAHAMTVAAGCAGLAAAAAFGWGTIGGCVLGAVLLQTWYLLDHVDGQLARFHGTASLDGVQLDYLMHHLLNLLLPIGIGWGLAVRGLEPLWLLAGLIWGVSLLLLGLHHDARYKAFIQRLKCVQGTLEVMGGGGGRPSPPVLPERNGRAIARWSARKACEPHVIMNSLTLLALWQWIVGDQHLRSFQAYTGVMAALAMLMAAVTLIRSIRGQAAEREFKSWYQPPADQELKFKHGWWIVAPAESIRDGDRAEQPPVGLVRRSSDKHEPAARSS